MEAQKNEEKEAVWLTEAEKEQRAKQFKEQAQRQREKIKALKTGGAVEEPDKKDRFLEEPAQAVKSVGKASKLTADNLEKHEVASHKAAKAAASNKGGAKPAWARTEKQQEEEKDAEIDDLLEFAYELDYE